MKISVVTAVMNRRQSMPATLYSLRAQTHSQVEHIIQDGGSTDGTLAYLQGHSYPDMHIQSQPDKGIYDAINLGLARATGDVVGLLHSDDLFADVHILADIAALMQDHAIDGVYGDLDYVNAAGHVVRHWHAGAFDRAKLRRGWMPPHPTLYLRKNVLDALGPYDTGFKIAGDYEGMLRLLLRDDLRLAYLPKVMVQMRTGGASNASLRHLIRKSCEDYRAIKRHQIGGMGTLISKNLSKLGQFRV